MAIELDLFEYANDPAAQAAYVTGSAEAVKENFETGADTATFIGDADDNDYWVANKIVVSPSIICSGISIYLGGKTGNPSGDLTFRLETESAGKPSGTLVHVNATNTKAPVENAWNKVKFTEFDLPAGTYWLVVYLPDQTTNNHHNWTGDADGGVGTRSYSTNHGASWSTPDIVYHYFRLYGRDLQCFSESTIKQQGSYSLKILANQATSLNEYLERTIGSPINLSGKKTIRFDLWSSRTGSNIKIGIRDSGGQWTEVTPNIVSANTWQNIEWDISGVSDVNKDAIDRIRITIVNADADNVSYIDNMYSLVSGSAVISGGGTLVGTGKKSGVGTAAISGGGTLVAAATKESAGEAIISGGGSLVVTGEKFEPDFYFEANLIGDFEYIENIDEIKNHIIIEGEEYSESDKFFKTISGDNMLDKSIEDRHIKEVVSDLPYETQALVSLTKDVMVPFYLPTTMLKLYYVKLNLYFPGFQDGDYPDNSNIVYIPHFQTQCKTLRATNGTVDLDFYEPKCIAGNSVGGGNYYWHRYFFKFDISPYFGFKLITAELRWVLENKYFYGSGSNAQISMILDAVSDFGTLRRSHWSLSSIQSFGVVNQYTDSLNMEYYKNIQSWLQTQLDNAFKFVCFRLKGESEPTDVNNANNYRTAGHIIALQLAEDTNTAVSIYADNGSGFGSVIGSYSTDQEDIDLTSHFSGSGRKRLKFTCSKIRRIDILIRIGLTIDRA